MQKIFLVMVGVFVFKNIIFETIIEEIGTAAAGAKVELDHAKISLFTGRAAWDRIQVSDNADSWKNFLETGKCKFRIELVPLFAGKLIIDSMVVDKSQTGTKRLSNGKIESLKKENINNKKPFRIKTSAVQQLEKEKGNIQLPAPELFEKKLDTDEIIVKLKLLTPEKIEALNIFAEERFSFWEKKLKKTIMKKE